MSNIIRWTTADDPEALLPGSQERMYDSQRHDYRTPEEIHEDAEAYARSLKRIPTAANLAWQARLDATRKRYMVGGKI